MIGMLFGILCMAWGLHVFRNPDSEWFRLLERIPDDVEHGDDDLLRIEIGGVLSVLLGLFLFFLGLSKYLDSNPLGTFITSLGLGCAGFVLGVYAILRPESPWFRRKGDQGKASEPRVWIVKLAGIVITGISVLAMVLSAQFLFAF